MRPAIALSTALLIPALLQMSTGNQLTAGDKRFLEQAAQINMTETHLGQMAQQKAASGKIKDFGKTLENDFTNGNEKLSALADRFAFKVPQAIDEEHQLTIQRFQNLPAEQFDRQFVQNQIQVNKQLIDKFARERRRAQDPYVEAYARQMVPVLERHLEIAQSLAA